VSAICITGGTGYIGSRLIPLLAACGHELKAVVRPGSENKLPAAVSAIVADPLTPNSYTESLHGCDTFVHLIGVPHPGPAKAAQFRAIDLPSIQVAVKAARDAGIRHFIYLSVAHPAPMMHDFIAVRAEGEALLRASGMRATFVRPWYVLGPGHWWPYPLVPFYWVAELLPATRESARRLGLISISQMLRALVWAVDNPPDDVRVLDVPQIRKLSRSIPS
jgi:nucleoside-diphosphate-sugar epimerase